MSDESILENTSNTLANSQPQQASEGWRLAFYNFHEGYVRNYITLADTKASWGFTLISAIAAYWVSKYGDFEMFDNGHANIPLILLMATTGVLLVASAVFFFLVIYPRLQSEAEKDIVFFGGVARYTTSTEYAEVLSSLSETDVSKRRMQHCYEVAVICKCASGEPDLQNGNRPCYAGLAA
ncbi:Pycsar system effector family protein [Pseudovibrio sp. Ad37]|uniref:Pycsar system effector family protein n=1 Tax=Pseudovibrio sp. Ad37 TaxID=989422 RepID=UPI0007AEE145|nr:Pycsar system effector family protein [Pseudovibrio sp. Ad37]KZL28393.1 hypothetical protein PsAD37_00880 [Pseudovibrio sp. Ad37]